MTDWINAGPIDALPDGERKVIAAEDHDILLINSEGVFYAVEDQCSHQALPLADGPIDGDQITCPFHNAEFCLKSGEALSAPAFEAIACFDIKTQDGVIWVSPTPNNA